MKDQTYIDYGKWVQDPLSASLWANSLKQSVAKELLGEDVDLVFPLDHHYLGTAVNATKGQTLIADVFASPEKLTEFRNRHESIMQKVETEALTYINSRDLDISTLFQHMFSISAVWWVSGIIIARELDSFLVTEAGYESLAQVESLIEGIRRPTLLEKQHRDVLRIKALAGGASSVSELKKKLQEAEFAEAVEVHLQKFSWFGTHHLTGEGYSQEKLFADVLEAKEKAVTTASTETPNEFLRLVADLIYWRTHCAEVLAIVSYETRDFLTEFGLAHGADSYDALLAYTANEILTAAKEGSPLPEIQNRDHYALQGEQIVIGTDLEGLKSQYLITDVEEVDVLSGTVACRGEQVTGTARVILGPKEFDQFNDGEILIAPETTPDFVPLMKKASAILTEAGGITSHAAIVSRELGVPCITGIKNITEILESGKEIQVDTEKGEVQIM